MRIRCHIATVQPTGHNLRIYFGEQGHKHLQHDLSLITGEDYELAETSGKFITAGPFMFIWVEDDDPVIIAHEAMHCATYVWHQAGANLHIHDNDEVTAYTMGHIMELIYNALEKEYELQNNQ